MAEPRSRMRFLFATLVSLALAVTLVGVVAKQIVRSPPPLRTVILTMRDYTFNSNNPTLTFRNGERVRFVIRNEETTPIRHNFSIPGLNVPCDQELGPGEIRHVIVTLTHPGTYEYLCCTHRAMKGALIVTAR